RRGLRAGEREGIRTLRARSRSSSDVIGRHLLGSTSGARWRTVNSVWVIWSWTAVPAGQSCKLEGPLGVIARGSRTPRVASLLPLSHHEVQDRHGEPRERERRELAGH